MIRPLLAAVLFRLADVAVRLAVWVVGVRVSEAARVTSADSNPVDDTGSFGGVGEVLSYEPPPPVANPRPSLIVTSTSSWPETQEAARLANDALAREWPRYRHERGGAC